MEYEHLRYEAAEGIATITLNRPDRLNALNVRLGVEIRDALERCGADPDVRCVVLTGAGRAFCAGDDLRAGAETGAATARITAPNGGPVQPGTPGYAEVIRRYLSGEGRWPAIVFAIRALPKPVIAMVNGYAYGAGFNLALACDFRIAAASATLATPFVQRGLGTGTNLLQQFVGVGVAARLVLTGDPITAAEAERLGIVTWAVPDAELAARTHALATRLAQGATTVLAMSKDALYGGWPEPPEQAYARQGYAVYLSSFTEDRAEGQRAFIEKRPPRFQGR
jgi:2-(1,2-epoxy-1,2-dihydrophenyl)acetyl-CoA isomerase